MTTHGYVGDCREQRSLDVIKTTMEQMQHRGSCLQTREEATQKRKSLRSVKEIEAGCVRARYTPAQRVLTVRMKTFDEIHGWW